MSTFIVIIVVVGLVAFWRLGYADLLFHRIGFNLGRGAGWVGDAAGAWVNLLDYLPYRDFVEEDDVVETEDGWLWAGLELESVPTDGYGGTDWNHLSAKLNRVLTGLEDRTWVQVITEYTNDTAEGEAVFERLAAGCGDDTVKTLLNARAAHLRREGAEGFICTPRTYAFIGRRKETLHQKLSVNTIIRVTPLVELEMQDFEELRAEVLLARESFADAFRNAGGRATPLTSEQIFGQVFKCLNPELAEVIPPPRLGYPPNKLGVAYTRGIQPPPVDVFAGIEPEAEETRADDDFSSFLNDLAGEGIIDGEDSPSATAAPREPVLLERPPLWITGAALFADSPRERLCREPVEVRRDHFVIGERPVMVISLQQLPTHVYCGLSETLTRHPRMCFPFQIVTSFESKNRWEADNELAKKFDRLTLNLEVSRPDQIEAISADEIAALRNDIRRGEAKLGKAGVSVVFTAPDLAELRRRRNIVLQALNEMEGLQGTVEKHLPLPQLVATMPCAPHNDKRRRACLSRDAAGMIAWTGSSRGPVRPGEAIHVYETVDGGQVFWHPHHPSFPSGMSLMIGGAGSGKSGHLNLQRTYLRSAGYMLFTIDFGAASYRVCKALGGIFIDVCDARRSYKLGLFDIRVKPGEKFAPEELVQGDLPRHRLAEVENLMEQLCLDLRKKETSLSHELANYLRQAVRATYRRLVRRTPRLDDFLFTLGQALKDERPLAAELTNRLEIYASHGALGRFLNESPDAQEVNLDSPYIVFNLSTAKEDPRLMLVATLAVNSWLRRVMHMDRRIKKAFDVDEFNVVAKNPLISDMIDETVRTARKLNMIGTVASQRAGDFAEDEKNPAAAAIKDNCETRWIFRTPNPEQTARIFQLKPGVAALVARLQTQTSEHWRDCVLLWPGGGCAHLRLRHGALDKRLLLGASGFEERVTVNDALRAAVESAPGRRVPARLQQALAADALGAEVAVGA